MIIVRKIKVLKTMRRSMQFQEVCTGSTNASAANVNDADDLHCLLRAGRRQRGIVHLSSEQHQSCDRDVIFIVC